MVAHYDWIVGSRRVLTAGLGAGALALLLAGGCSKENAVDASNKTTAGGCLESKDTLAALCPAGTALESSSAAATGENVCPTGAGEVKDPKGKTTSVCKATATCSVKCAVLCKCGIVSVGKDAVTCAPCGSCTPGQTTCVGTKVLSCGPQGTPSTEVVDCTGSGQLCAEGKCVAKGACGNGVCEPGETAALCPKDCSSECTPGKKFCEGQTLYGCDGGGKKVSPGTTCAAGKQVCSNTQGQCVNANICGNGVCEGDEAKTCPEDCKVATCGNSTCEPGESASSCPQDCATAVCGNKVCEKDETSTCPQDCAAQVCKPQVRQCIGTVLQVCNANGTALAAEVDCKESGQVCGNGQCQSADVCGNGVCEKNESITLCQFDCSAKCGNKICEKPFEDPVKCADDCPTECGDKKCSAGETSQSCPGDCPTTCGNGVCDPSETHDSCSKDCYCGNKVCEDRETTATVLPPGSTLVSCPQDCSILTCQSDGDCNDKIACTRDICKKEPGQPSGKCDYPTDAALCGPGERCLGGQAYDTDVPNSGCCADKDGDGKAAVRCGGNDCFDSPAELNAPFYKGADPASVYPGAPEPCDGVDHNCSGANAPKTDAQPTQLTKNFGNKKVFGAARIGGTALTAWLGEAGGEPVVQYLLLDVHDGPKGDVQNVPLPSGLNYGNGASSDLLLDTVQVVASSSGDRFGVAFRTCSEANDGGDATYRVAWVDAKSGALLPGSPVKLPINPPLSCQRRWDFVAVGGTYFLAGASSNAPLRVSESGGITSSEPSGACTEFEYYGALGTPSRLARFNRIPGNNVCTITGTGFVNAMGFHDPSGGAKGFVYLPVNTYSYPWRRLWDGDAIVEVYDRKYIRTAIDGTELANASIWDKVGVPRALGLGVSDQAIGGQPLVLVLVSDQEGANVFSVVRKQDGSKALDTGILATGTDVTDGFVAWDAKSAGFQAYYVSALNGVHQLYSVPVVCE